MYKSEDVIQVTVTAIKPYGAFVVTDDDVDGFIHISEISEEFVNRISNYVVVGEKIVVKVIDINDRGQLRLSLKAIRNSRRRYRGYRIQMPDEKSFESLKERLPQWIREKLEEKHD